jgi:hypothetical protein
MVSNIQNINLDEEDIINKDVFKAIRDDLFCDICLGLLYKPKQCGICETTYCENCIKDWGRRDKSCPVRCKDFHIEDCARVVKNMLGRLKFKCKSCLTVNQYEKHISDHLEKECQQQSSVKTIKCPLCKDCNKNLEESDIDEYNDSIVNSFEIEILKLRNEIKSYKEVINILQNEQEVKNKSNNNTKSVYEGSNLTNETSSINKIVGDSISINNSQKIDIRWKTKQKKTNHTFHQSNKKIIINYSSCWNMYLADYIFDGSKDVEFGLKVKNLGETLNNHYIGFINSKFSFECLCLSKPYAWFIKDSGLQFKYQGNEVFKNDRMVINNDSEKEFLFNFNAKTCQLKIYGRDLDSNKESNNLCLYGRATLEGTGFQFFVSKCNPGKFEYSFC